MNTSRSDFPNDDDGEVLYQLAKKGIDLSQKRKIEFTCYAPSEEVAQQVVDDLATYGYTSSVFVDDHDGKPRTVSIYAAITMILEYELVVIEQRRLNLILKKYNTKCDGWVTES